MDLSKLNRMSKTPGQSPRSDGPPPSESEMQAAPAYACDAAPGPMIAAQVWISAILGIICLLIGQNFARWLIATLAGGTYVTGYVWGAPVTAEDPPQGTPIGYWELAGGTALTEAAMFLFGLALLLEAAFLIATVKAGPGVRRATLAVALGITALATAFNLYAVIHLIGIGITLPLMSLLAAGFGGYMLMYLWQEWNLAGRAAPVGLAA